MLHPRRTSLLTAVSLALLAGGAAAQRFNGLSSPPTALPLRPATAVHPSTAQTVPHPLAYAPGKSITLNVPAGLDIHVAAAGLKRIRFLAQAPDGRIFATGMYNLADNSRGTVYILDGYDAKTHTFTRITHYLDNLRNPNNLAFWTDPATHQSWLYLPLTDKLLRYKYSAGDMKPSAPPETLIHFPDYGLNYKYGGWHLTRTVALAELHGKMQLYVSTGSSCNYCQEREVARAAVLRMNPDGTDQKIVAQGLRNAVDLRFVPNLDGGSLFATDMGDDHLGDKLPEDTFFELDSNDHRGPIARDEAPRNSASGSVAGVPNYGWPTCYFADGKPVHDTTPLPEMPPAGDLSTESERPRAAGTASHGVPTADSVYGVQDGSIAAAGTNLAAGGGKTVVRDPNADLGTPPHPLTSCEHVPAAYTTFAAHSSPLGLVYFGEHNTVLRDSFLVALHGAGHPGLGTGYRVVRLTPGDHTAHDFLTGFLTRNAAGVPLVHGRPCGLLRLAPDTFLLTDDYLGLVYILQPAS
jgi:glucose/arabinose dehydrogenase